MAIQSINKYSFLLLSILIIYACGEKQPENYTPQELTFDMLVGDWELQKIIKGKKAVEGGVTLDYITKTMTLEKGRFNTYTNSHIPWGSKYQTELKSDTLLVYNGTQVTWYTFKVTLSRDGNNLLLQNIIEDEEEYYIKKAQP